MQGNNWVRNPEVPPYDDGDPPYAISFTRGFPSTADPSIGKRPNLPMKRDNPRNKDPHSSPKLARMPDLWEFPTRRPSASLNLFGSPFFGVLPSSKTGASSTQVVLHTSDGWVPAAAASGLPRFPLDNPVLGWLPPQPSTSAFPASLLTSPQPVSCSSFLSATPLHSTHTNTCTHTSTHTHTH